VPEYDGEKPTLTENKPLTAYREALAELGIKGKPVIVGPYTFIKLSKGYSRTSATRFYLATDSAVWTNLT
jgi:5-methyltetrahydropteroyltriglutamate--homocysteine methyltransferase